MDRELEFNIKLLKFHCRRTVRYFRQGRRDDAVKESKKITSGIRESKAKKVSELQSLEELGPSSEGTLWSWSDKLSSNVPRVRDRSPRVRDRFPRARDRSSRVRDRSPRIHHGDRALIPYEGFVISLRGFMIGF
ncbi:hypothetical protein V8G54_013008 [Vigna mungo]|uniref:Uncharacterized protein n=1 Tax=Vigna mungo TaxID=3915 RepID=A0AAQ3NVC4_VIGMU